MDVLEIDTDPPHHLDSVNSNDRLFSTLRKEDIARTHLLIIRQGRLAEKCEKAIHLTAVPA